MEDLEDRTGPPDGTHPVEEHPPESPGPVRTTSQYLVMVIAALMILAGLLWVLLPLA